MRGSASSAPPLWSVAAAPRSDAMQCRRVVYHAGIDRVKEVPRRRRTGGGAAPRRWYAARSRLGASRGHERGPNGGGSGRACRRVGAGGPSIMAHAGPCRLRVALTTPLEGPGFAPGWTELFFRKRARLVIVPAPLGVLRRPVSLLLSPCFARRRPLTDGRAACAAPAARRRTARVVQAIAVCAGETFRWILQRSP